jgi:hypothetical protein
MKALLIIGGIALFLGIPTGWDYSYYILLRWFISILAAYVAFKFYDSGIQAWAFVFGGVAFLFNPIVPIYLNKSSWVAIDFVAAILFFVAAHSLKKRGSN